jgi:hypothetical protein
MARRNADVGNSRTFLATLKSLGFVRFSADNFGLAGLILRPRSARRSAPPEPADAAASI